MSFIDDLAKKAKDLASRGYTSLVGQQQAPRANPQVGNAVRTLQQQSLANPALRAQNRAKISALLSNQQVSPNSYQQFNKAVFTPSTPLEAIGQGIGTGASTFARSVISQPLQAIGGNLQAFTPTSGVGRAVTKVGNSADSTLDNTAVQAAKQHNTGVGKLADFATNTAGGIAAFGVNPAAGFAQQYSQLAAPTFKNSQDAGVDPRRTAIVANASALPGAALSTFAFRNMLNPSGKILSKGTGRIVESGISNAVQGGATQLLQNLAAQHSYNPNQSTIEGVPQAAAMGLATGAAFGGIHELSNSPKAKAAAKTVTKNTKTLFQDQPVIPPRERYLISDYADVVMGLDKTYGSGAERNLLAKQAMSAAKRAGLDITSGSQKARFERIADWLENQDMRERSQGGYIALPGRKGKPLDNTGARPQAELQAALEKAHNSGDKVAEQQIAQKLGDPAMAAQSMSPEAKQAMIASMRKGEAPTVDAVHPEDQFFQNNKPDMTPPGKQTTSPDDFLPTQGTKQVKNIDKMFRSTRSIIERQGEPGKQLGSLLQKTRDTEEMYQGELASRLPTVRSLKGKDYENFVDATQGLVEPKNPKVAQAIQEWQTTHPSIRERAVNAGLEVGDLGPNYYPHFIDYDKVFKDKNTYNEAINHIVKTGQAPDTAAAIKLLGYARDVSRNRKFGNLEASRLVDLPFYDKTPNSLVSYIQGSSHRIAQTENLGKDDSVALKLIDQAGKEGYDTEAMKNAYDVASGARKYSQTALDASGKMRGYLSTTRLGLGAITNSSQSVNTGIVTGHMRTLGSMIGQLDPKNRAFVQKSGVTADGVLNDLKTETGFVGKTLGKVTAPGFGKVEGFNRSVAAIAGKRYADSLAAKGDVNTLKKLGVEGEIGKKLTEAQQIQAARKIVEKTQFKVDPQDLPGWVDSPLGKLVAQFRTFSYSQSKFFSNEVLKPAAKGNFKPLARLAAALPVGYVLAEVKRDLNNRPEEEDKKRKAIEAFGNVGGAGLIMDVYRSMVPLNNKYLTPDRRVSMAIGTFGGPTAGSAAELVGAVSEIAQKKKLPENSANMNGKVAIKSGDGYNDATQLSRLGLRQIPIIGSRLQNTLVPYKPKDSKTPTSSGYSAATGTSNSDTGAEDALLFTKKQQEFLKLKPAEQREAAREDPELREALDKKQQLAALRKAPELLPLDISPESEQTINKFARLTSTQKKKQLDIDPKAEFQLALANFEKDKLNGNLSKVDEIKKASNLMKLRAGADFQKATRDLYSLDKSSLYELLSGDPDGKSIAEDIIKYGDTLEKAGVAKNKFRDSRGNVAIRPKEKSGGGGSKISTYSSPYSSLISARGNLSKQIANAKVGRVTLQRKV